MHDPRRSTPQSPAETGAVLGIGIVPRVCKLNFAQILGFMFCTEVDVLLTWYEIELFPLT